METRNDDRNRLEGDRRCSDFRDCGQGECIFYDGSGPCWSLVSPFKLRRRPAQLLKDTAERCGCLDLPCTECDHYEG